MKFKALLCLVFLACSLSQVQLNAQCNCTIDLTCPLTNPAGGICPDTFPNATIGQLFDEDITFYMPQTVTDPGTGTVVDLQRIQITSIAGLPDGLNWSCSSPNCEYLPQSNPPSSELGCIGVCGTPTPFNAPGIYNVTVYLLADVFVPSFGITLTNQPQTYQAELLLISLGGNSGYSFAPASGCEPVTVDFEALIDQAPNSPTTWAWDFGDGTTSTSKTVSHTFVADGNYAVTLNTTVNNYKITNLCINSVNQGWCNDVEELQCNCGTPIIGACPDIYFQIVNANGDVLFSSGVANNATSNCWSNLNVELSNPPYSLRIFDEDAITADDDLGQFAFNVTSTGNKTYSGAGGTAGTYAIGLAVDTVITNVDTVRVFPIVNPTISVSGLTDLCPGQFTLLISSQADGNQWYRNGNPVSWGLDDTLQVSSVETGTYTLEYTSPSNCVGTSQPQVITYCLSNTEVLNNALNISILPNPNNGQFVIKAELGEDAGNCQFALTNLLGQELYQSSFELSNGGSLNQSVNLSHLPSGIYMAVVRQGAKTSVQKVIIE